MPTLQDGPTRNPLLRAEPNKMTNLRKSTLKKTLEDMHTVSQGLDDSQDTAQYFEGIRACLRAINLRFELNADLPQDPEIDHFPKTLAN